MRNLIEYDFPKLVQKNENGSRVYLTPTGEKYPSVTAVTGFGNNDYLIEWRDRVGHEEANQITRRAANRGTRIHKLCEDHLLGNPVEISMFDKEVFDSMSKYFPKVGDIHCIEKRIYSHILKVAGTVDLIAEYNNELAVIDWKTSRWAKSADDIGGYFMQAAAYAQCFYELTDINIDKLVIIMGIDDHPAKEFIEDKSFWLKKFKHQRYKYYGVKKL